MLPIIGSSFALPLTALTMPRIAKIKKTTPRTLPAIPAIMRIIGIWLRILTMRTHRTSAIARTRP